MIEIIIIFFACVGIGVIAAMAGVGGGVLFTPLMMAFTNLDTTVVRATGLALAMMTSAMGGRRYLLAGAAKLNFIIFTAVFMSLGALTGSIVGIHVVKQMGKYGESLIRLALGILLFFIVFVMSTFKHRESAGGVISKWARMFGLVGEFEDPATGKVESFAARRIVPSILAFFGVGVISGMFGLGAGWALVPVLNLLMGLPLKVAVATSTATFIMADAPALWTYAHEHALYPIIAGPALLGVALGSNIGAKLALKAKVKVIKLVVLAVLIFAGAQLILRALGLL